MTDLREAANALVQALAQDDRGAFYITGDGEKLASDLADALALPQPTGEPVGWQRRLRNINTPVGHPFGAWSTWKDCSEEHASYTRQTGGRVYGAPELEAEVRPIYATPADALTRSTRAEAKVERNRALGWMAETIARNRALRDAEAERDAAIARAESEKAFQSGVKDWMAACFGAEISSDRVERGDRLLEEVLELLQSGGYDPARVPMLTEYVYNRPVGEPAQEVGGVMVCVAAYCLAFGLDMHDAAAVELARVWTKVEQIREKQKTKPTGSPLPAAPTPDTVKGEA